MEKFRKLGISEPILKAIEEEKFEKPSEIQEKSIPLILAGRDVIAGSATGSGKTLVFGSVIIFKCKSLHGVQALVLTPTRELAEQDAQALKKFSKYNPLEIASVYGGVSINPQIRQLRDADVVVGTPGRILDHLQRKTLDLRDIKILVLDEADRMFDMGFIDDVERIIRNCPTNRQTLLFSATISQEVVNISKKYLKNPVEVSAEVYVDPTKLTQIYYDAQDNLKFSLLVHLLKNEKSDLVMIFCNTQRNTDFIARNLKAAGINALAIHGGFSQEKRNRTMEQFHSKNVKVLVCTDVASRGLDIKGISHIYNYDIPKDSKDYIHRIGRTARAGKEGKVINIVANRDYDNFNKVVNTPDITITHEDTPYVEQVKVAWMERSRRFSYGRGGERREFRGSGNFGGARRYGDRSTGRFSNREESGERRDSNRGSSRSYGNRSSGRFSNREDRGERRYPSNRDSGREEGGERRGYGGRRFPSSGNRRSSDRNHRRSYGNRSRRD